MGKRGKDETTGLCVKRKKKSESIHLVFVICITRLSVLSWLIFKRADLTLSLLRQILKILWVNPTAASHSTYQCTIQREEVVMVQSPECADSAYQTY